MSLGTVLTNKISLPIFTAGLLAATVLLAPCAPAVAQERQERVAVSTEFSAQQQGEQKKAAPAPKRAAPQRAAPHAAPQRATQQRAAPHRAAPRVAAPRRAQPRVASPQKAAPRVAAPHRAAPRTVARPQATPRVVRQPKSSPKVGAPAAARKTASPALAPRTVTPHGTRAVTASRLRGMPARGAGRTAIHGHNYSVWRSGYRVRHGSGWRTFVALSTLGAILIDQNEYYPYAYISAPENYCEGLTEDGCELQWQEVQTEEGDVFDQCVAYCPWQ